MSFLFLSLLIVSPRHWLLKINFRNSISLYIILLSPKAEIPNSFRSSLVKNSKLSPSIIFSLKSSIQSPKPIWLSHSLTSLTVHSFTILVTKKYFSFPRDSFQNSFQRWVSFSVLNHFSLCYTRSSGLNYVVKVRIGGIKSWNYWSCHQCHVSEIPLKQLQIRYLWAFCFPLSRGLHWFFFRTQWGLCLLRTPWFIVQNWVFRFHRHAWTFC